MEGFRGSILSEMTAINCYRVDRQHELLLWECEIAGAELAARFA